MAIRFSPAQQTSADIYFTMTSGWRVYGMPTSGVFIPTALASGLNRFYPSALSRPGNLGTAYTGVWTENVTTPNDNHRPIPFKDLVLAAGIILGPDLPFIQALNHRSPI